MSGEIIHIKCVLLGETAVGKSSLINRFISNTFKNDFTSTMVGYCSTKQVYYEKTDQKINYEIWDTAGQEKYRSLGKHFYKDSFIVILVYNITSRESFENLKNVWLEDVMNYGEKYKVLAVVGNKCDLYEQEAVPEEDGRKFAQEHDAIFMNVSARDGTNINTLFDYCVKKYFDPNFQVDVIEERKRDENSVVIKRRKKKKSTDDTKKKCCE